MLTVGLVAALVMAHILSVPVPPDFKNPWILRVSIGAYKLYIWLVRLQGIHTTHRYRPINRGYLMLELMCRVYTLLKRCFLRITQYCGFQNYVSGRWCFIELV